MEESMRSRDDNNKKQNLNKNKVSCEKARRRTEQYIEELGLSVSKEELSKLSCKDIYALNYALKRYDKFSRIKKRGDIKRLAEEMGIHHNTIRYSRRVLTKLGLAEPLRRNIVTDEIISEVVRMIDAGMSLRQISKKMGIKYEVLSQALLRRGIYVKKFRNKLRDILKKYGPLKKSAIIQYMSPKRLEKELGEDVKKICVLNTTYYYLPEQYDEVMSMICHSLLKIKRVKRIARNSMALSNFLRFRISDERMARDVARCIETKIDWLGYGRLRW